MKRMTRMGSKKSHSWWWNSHISPKNSKWLAENLEEMDRCVKEMLKLIEEEGDSFAKKAEMYYKRRPELISHVEDFYRMYRALAERYDQVTGELRRNIPSDLQSSGSGSGSDFGSEPPSPSVLLHLPELTPERKPPRPKPNPRAAGFDFFLGSGGSSDLSRKGSDGSSSSDSDSDSDDSKDISHENELHEHEEKGSNGLHEHMENEDHMECSSKISALENKLIAADEKLQVVETEILSLQQKLAEKNAESETEDVEPSTERKRVPELEKVVTALEAEISTYKKEIEGLKEAMAAATTQFKADLSHRDRAIEDCKTELANMSGSFSQEKTLLEAEATSLEDNIEEVKSEIMKISLEKSQLRAKVGEQGLIIQELESNTASSAELEKVVTALEAEISTYKKEIDGLKGVMAAATTQFKADLSHRDGAIEVLKSEIMKISLEKSQVQAKIGEQDHMIQELESNAADKLAFCAEHGKQIEELNRNLDALKLKVDTLSSEKEELGAKVGALIVDVKGRDERIKLIDEHMHQLHLEHAELITKIEVARRAGEKLQTRVKELEEEVDGQRLVILDSAERKREAIRQLCFSLEHYRDGYHQLRQVLQGHKRHAVIVT